MCGMAGQLMLPVVDDCSCLPKELCLSCRLLVAGATVSADSAVATRSVGRDLKGDLGKPNGPVRSL